MKSVVKVLLQSCAALLLLSVSLAAADTAGALPAASSRAPETRPAAPSAEDNALQLQPFISATLTSYSSSRDAFPGAGAAASSSSSSAAPSYAAIVSNETPPQKLHWVPALWESGRFLLVMHAFRLATEPSTRAELKGPFWGDYFDSVMGLGGWRDGDPRLVNYIGHPLEGAVSGFIYIQNDDHGRELEFDLASRRYWKSRMLAALWMSVFSLQFEMGPLSEASIGNVGKVSRPDGGSYMGAVDLVVTPTVGLAWMLGEDALDRYAIRGIERRTDSRVLRALSRGFLNPSRSFANMMRGKPPWYRDARPLSGAGATH